MHDLTTTGIDHVNIIASDLDASVRFYGTLLELDGRDPPPPLSPREIQWLFDANGRPLIHLRAGSHPDTTTGTGALDHVAFTCQGYDAVVARLGGMGVAWRTNAIPAIGLRQLFVRDPNGVRLELNFRGD